jgi:nucleotide-binding universal stress UspA family protein
MVALDGSERDARALAVATGLADLAHAPLHLLHVIEALPNEAAAQGEFLGLDRDAVSGRGALEVRLAETAARITAETGHRVACDVVESADLVEELVRRASLHDARVLVMATRAPGALKLAVVGGVVERVVRESPRPVVVVPPGAADMAGHRPRFERVLVPLDGSELSERALDFLISWPGAGAMEYVLLGVVAPIAVELGGTTAFADVRARLEAAADRVRARGAASVRVQAVEAGDPAPAILGAVREQRADVVAMTTRGASGLRRLAVGTVADAVVKASEVPLLLLTPASLGAVAGD